MELDPRRLLVLSSVAEHGTLAAAARALGHTASAVSQQLSRLEKDVGVALVERGAGRLELTTAGRLLADGGTRINAVLARTVRDLTHLGTPVAGSVTVGAPIDGLRPLAALVLASLATDHPRLVPRLVEIDLPEGLHALKLGELDVLVFADDRDTAVALPPGVRARALYIDVYRVVVPAAWTPPRAPEDLNGRPWIRSAGYTARGRAHDRFVAVHGIHPLVEHVARHEGTVHALMAAGAGATVASSGVAAELRTLSGGVITGLHVTGKYIPRILYRAGNLAAEAVVSCVLDATKIAMERAAEAAMTESDPIVHNVRDPSGS